MSFMRGLRTVRRVAVVCLVFLVYASYAHAQSTSASVSGAVADAQGGVLPGVTVTLTSRSQGTAMTATTDNEGRFVFQIVRPDTYQPVVKASRVNAVGPCTKAVGSPREAQDTRRD